MNGPKIKLTDSIHGEPPLACSGKEKEEIHPHKVTRIGQFCPCSNFQKV